MENISHSPSMPVPADITAANAAAWAFLGSPGSCWRSAEKIAIALEVRQAANCAYCQQRAQALSPFALAGEHDCASELPAVVVDVVHRLVTDASRLTEDWVLSLQDQGISAAAYVELVATSVFVMNVDLFHIGIGQPVDDLPVAGAGEPSGYLPSPVSQHMAWVPTLNKPYATAEADLFADIGNKPTNVLLALSLVPDAVRCLRYMEDRYYLAPDDVINVTSNGNKSLNRPQIELVATRVSAANECFYCSSSHALILSVSAEADGSKLDLGAALHAGSNEAGVSHAAELGDFVVALLAARESTDETLQQSRQPVIDVAGVACMIDAAGLVGSFQRMNRVANATGIELDKGVNAMSADEQQLLGLREFASANGSTRPGRLSSWLLNKLRSRLLHRISSRAARRR